MVLMDNSQDMLTSAYGDSYVPNLLMDNYIGYFKPTGCYAYPQISSSEQLITAVTPTGLILLPKPVLQAPHFAATC
jgi:hypothetical protein